MVVTRRVLASGPRALPSQVARLGVCYGRVGGRRVDTAGERDAPLTPTWGCLLLFLAPQGCRRVLTVGGFPILELGGFETEPPVTRSVFGVVGPRGRGVAGSQVERVRVPGARPQPFLTLPAVPPVKLFPVTHTGEGGPAPRGRKRPFPF